MWLSCTHEGWLIGKAPSNSLQSDKGFFMKFHCSIGISLAFPHCHVNITPKSGVADHLPSRRGEDGKGVAEPNPLPDHYAGKGSNDDTTNLVLRKPHVACGCSIDSFHVGRDVFGVLPTDYGKSLCYACLPEVFDQILQQPKSSIVVIVTPLTANGRQVILVVVCNSW